MVIDTHCHLDLYRDPQRIAREMERRSVTTIAVTNLPSHFEIGYAHTRRFRRIRLAFGLHPLMTDRHSSAELKKFERLLTKTSYIGEVGLDYSREGKSTIKDQLRSFRFVLRAIGSTPRFLTLHSRGAEAEVLDLLKEYGIRGAVFHWYSGPLSLVDRLIDAGHFLSINPAMVRSNKGRQIVNRTPKERVLTETDGPHLRMGKRPANPSDVEAVLRFLAKS